MICGAGLVLGKLLCFSGPSSWHCSTNVKVMMPNEEKRHFKSSIFLTWFLW